MFCTSLQWNHLTWRFPFWEIFNYELSNSYWMSCSLCFSRHWFNSSKLSNLFVQSCSLSSLITFLIPARSVMVLTSFLTLGICLFSLLFFCSVSLVTGLSIDLFRELTVLWFSWLSLFSILLISAQNKLCLSSACFGFLLFFFFQVRWKIRLLIQNFSSLLLM